MVAGVSHGYSPRAGGFKIWRRDYGEKRAGNNYAANAPLCSGRTYAKLNAMHELAVTQSILEIANQHAAQAGAVRVTNLYISLLGSFPALWMTPSSSIGDIVSRARCAKERPLHFERIPPRLRWDCGTSYTLPGELIACPHRQSIAHRSIR